MSCGGKVIQCIEHVMNLRLIAVTHLSFITGCARIFLTSDFYTPSIGRAAEKSQPIHLDLMKTGTISCLSVSNSNDHAANF
jgi:hypothetical protein